MFSTHASRTAASQLDKLCVDIPRAAAFHSMLGRFCHTCLRILVKHGMVCVLAVPNPAFGDRLSSQRVHLGCVGQVCESTTTGTCMNRSDASSLAQAELSLEPQLVCQAQALLLLFKHAGLGQSNVQVRVRDDETCQSARARLWRGAFLLFL